MEHDAGTVYAARNNVVGVDEKHKAGCHDGAAYKDAEPGDNRFLHGCRLGSGFVSQANLGLASCLTKGIMNKNALLPLPARFLCVEVAFVATFPAFAALAIEKFLYFRIRFTTHKQQ